MKKIVIWMLSAMVAGLTVDAQTEVLDIEVGEDSIIQRQFGENRRHFVNFFMEGGLIADLDANAGNYNFPRSYQFGMGFQYKLKITGWLATGAEILVESYNYRLNKDRPVTFPDSTFHNNEKIRQHLLSGMYYIRLNMDKRGNEVGKYFDMGIGGGWQIGSRYLFEEDLPRDQVKNVTIKKYDATSGDSWYLFTRLGVNNVSVYGKYRMDELFKKDRNYPASPSLTIGFRLAFH